MKYFQTLTKRKLMINKWASDVPNSKICISAVSKQEEEPNQVYIVKMNMKV